MDACEYIINIFSSVIAIEYMNYGLEKKYVGWRHLCLSVGGSIAYFALVTALNLVTDFEGILCVFYTIGLILYGTAALNGNFFSKVFLSLMWTLNLLFSTFMVYGVMGVLTGKNILLSDAGRETLFLASLAATAVKFLMGRIIIRLYDGRKEDAAREDWLIAGVLVVILLAGLNMFRLEMDSAAGKARYGQMTFMLFGQFTGVLLLEWLYQRLGGYRRQRMALEYQDRLVRELGHWRHDMSGKLGTLYRLQQSGQYGEVEKTLKKLCAEFEKLPELTQSTCSSGLNHALSKALALCGDRGIQFSYVVFGRMDIMDNTDLESLMWNLFSNGIEACQQAEETRILNVFLCAEKNQLKIRLENTLSESILKNNPQLRSTKEDKTVHGFGMETVYGILDKYQGEYLCQEENGLFIQELSLHL